MYINQKRIYFQGPTSSHLTFLILDKILPDTLYVTLKNRLQGYNKSNNVAPVQKQNILDLNSNQTFLEKNIIILST